MILDPSNNGAVIAMARPEGKGRPPNWVLITERILFRAQGDMVEILPFLANRIRGLASGMIGVATVAGVEMIRKITAFLFT